MPLEAIQGKVTSEPLNRNFSRLDSKAHNAEEVALLIQQQVQSHINDTDNPHNLQTKLDELSQVFEVTLEEKLNRAKVTETVTVGQSGDFSSIGDAIEYFSKKYPDHKKGSDYVRGIIQLVNYTMNEQVFVYNLDLSWLTITTTQSPIILNRSSLTRSVNVDISPEFTVRPAFACFNGTLPIIDVLFDMNTSGSGNLFTGIFLDNSDVKIMPNKGVRNSTFIGCCAVNGSNVVAHYSVFSWSGNRSSLNTGNYENAYGDGFRIWNSTLSASYANADNTGDNAFNISQGSRAQLNRAHANNCGHHGLLVTGGSIASARNSEFKDTIDDNVVAYAGSAIDLRNSDCSGAVVGCGVIATRSSNINFEGGTAQNCGNGGIYANRGSSIDANEANVDNCPDDAVTSANGSVVNFNYGSAKDSGRDGLHCTHGSIITAHLATVTGATRNGALAYASQIYVEQANLSGAGQRCVEATRGGYVDAFNANLSNAGDRGVYAYYSDVNCAEANITNAGHRGVEATRGARVNAFGADTTGANDNGFCVFNGATIVAVDGIGTSNRGENVITRNGLIIR